MSVAATVSRLACRSCLHVFVGDLTLSVCPLCGGPPRPADPREVAWNRAWESVSDLSTLDWGDVEEGTIKLLANCTPYKIRNILEAGCGSGRITARFAAERGCTATLVDSSEEAIRLARRSCADAGVICSLVQSDFIAASRMLGRHDVVWCGGVLEHFERADQLAWIEAMIACARPGGRVVISVPNAADPVYWIGRAIQEHLGSWPYGDERPEETLSWIADYTPLKLVREAAYAPDAGWRFVPGEIGEKLRKVRAIRSPGHLIGSVFERP